MDNKYWLESKNNIINKKKMFLLKNIYILKKTYFAQFTQWYEIRLRSSDKIMQWVY